MRVGGGGGGGVRGGGGGGWITRTRRSSGKWKPRMMTCMTSIELFWGVKTKRIYHFCYEQEKFSG